MSAERLIEAARELLRAKFDTIGNGKRARGIESDDGEKCWVVHSDHIFTLENALAEYDRAASTAEIEFNQKLKFVLENLAAMASLYDGCKNKNLGIKYHDDDLVSVHLGDLRKARALLAYIKSAASPKVTTP